LVSGGLSSFVTYRITKRSITQSAAEGKRERDHDSEERRLDRLHETNLADSNRNQQRRLDAYVAVQSLVNVIDKYATAHSTGIGAADSDSSDVPDIPDSMQSLARLVASEPVRLKMNELTKLSATLQAAVSEAWFWRAEEMNGKRGALDDFKRSNEQVKAVAKLLSEAITGVHHQMRRELIGESLD
jgi:hypothetical protein